MYKKGLALSELQEIFEDPVFYVDLESTDVVVLPPETNYLTDEDEADDDMVGVVEVNDVSGELEHLNTLPEDAATWGYHLRKITSNNTVVSLFCESCRFSAFAAIKMYKKGLALSELQEIFEDPVFYVDLEFTDVVVLPPETNYLTDEDEADDDMVGVAEVNDVSGELEHLNTLPEVILKSLMNKKHHP
ncbi:hypothetical protein QE152_g34831 [Popillia japonica]|uniref:Uncharacterized protein n=1 Tax=Popillia japonica TaxID=7064 RepID=A0AAW1ITJ7_POPJA